MTRPSNLLLQLIGQAPEEGITLDAIDDHAELDRKAITAATGVLFRRGLIERPALGSYRLTDAGRLALASGTDIKPGPRGARSPKRHAHGLRARMWRAMRLLTKFTIDDLLLRAARGDEAGARNNAVKYVNALEHGGYLVRMKHREPGEAPTSQGYFRWILLRDTGPKPPVWQVGKGRIHDQNTGQTISLGAADEKEVPHD